jgi:hypothetical protein
MIIKIINWIRPESYQYRLVAQTIINKESSGEHYDVRGWTNLLKEMVKE